MVAHEFRVTNTTGVPVEITGEAHTCTCTEVTVRKGTLAPGETIGLTLKVKPYLNRADNSVSCTLKTNHPKWKDWTYTLQYRCFPDAQVVPDRVDLGTTWIDRPAATEPDGSAPTPDAWLEIFGDDAGERAAKCRLDAPLGIEAHLKLTSETSIDGGIQKTRYPIFLKVRRTNPQIGSFAQPLGVRGLGTELPPSAMVIWTMTGPIAVDPPQAFVGVLGGGDRPEPVRLVVKSLRGNPFRIRATKTDSKLVAVVSEQSDESANEHAITLRATGAEPPSDAAAVSGDMTIETDLPGAESVRVPWSAFIRRSGDGR